MSSTNTYTPKVTVINPVVQRLVVDSSTFKPKKLRVAAYARVSTEQDEQQNSYEAQVSYYTHYIESHEEWEFAGIFADEGITGTNTKKRDGFKAMIDAALKGDIDVILTKSISRFARNTVDTLQAIRDLKAKGVEVIFEKERIHTLDPKCEVMLTIMSSLAQEESRSISENVRWGRQRSMQRGKVCMPFKHFLGYKKGADGKIEIDEDEAVIVRRIYDMFLAENSIRYIASTLTNEGVRTPAGKTNWSVSTVKSILTNEKYKGDALLQKTIVVDYLTKKVKKNDGDACQYYISNSHPAIIPADRFDLVQVELERRGRHGSRLSGKNVFTGKLVCGDCGGYFGHKVFHGKDKYRTEVWYCNQRYSGNHVCNTPVIKEYMLKKAFIAAMNKIHDKKEAYEAIYEAELKKLSNMTALEADRTRAEESLQDALDALQAIIRENATIKQDQIRYVEKYDAQKQIVDERKATLETAKKAILSQTAKKEKLRRFMKALTLCNGELTEFSEEMFTLAIEKIHVKVGETPILVFCFTDGTEITEHIVE